MRSGHEATVSGLAKMQRGGEAKMILNASIPQKTSAHNYQKTREMDFLPVVFQQNVSRLRFTILRQCSRENKKIGTTQNAVFFDQLTWLLPGEKCGARRRSRIGYIFLQCLLD